MMSDDEVVSLASVAAQRLALSPASLRALEAIQAEVSEAYQERIVELAGAIQKQAHALDRIQRTLAILVEAVQPSLVDKVPPMLRLATSEEEPDLASAVVVADPIGSGFTLSQKDLADALRLSQPEVSVLVRAFNMQDEDCAVRVRVGSRRNIVNYSAEAVDRFKELVASPPEGLTAEQSAALRRVRAKLHVAEEGRP